MSPLAAFRVLIIALPLAACAGYDGYTGVPVGPQQAEMREPGYGPTIGSDGFYDGGVFDRDVEPATRALPSE
ncbi:hypothetical protein [Magnetospirillum sp. UT-4]|uniref:hypothetical protein n=1 Tax=Magnetospirillum sp. UT-4 TaxID=2681467 RepID=UPI001384352C|nr:hypothetical protein [Magnetospirillum sp. UT-4]CAA7613621.1 exported hypothetical protein [Magnetospirillum sp. UT-4]